MSGGVSQPLAAAAKNVGASILAIVSVALDDEMARTAAPIVARCSTRYGASLSEGSLQLPPAATIGPPLAATSSWQWLAGTGAGWHTAPHITLATGVPVSVSTSSKAVVLVMNIACRQTSNSGANVTGLIEAVSMTVLSIDGYGAGNFRATR